MPAPDEYDLGQAIGRMEAKLDAVLSRGDLHDKRIGALEKARWTQTGAAGVVGAILTAGWAYLTNKG